MKSVTVHQAVPGAFALVVLLLLLPTLAGATTVTLRPGDSIQAAINAAASYDIIVLRPGTYHQRVNLWGKAITLRGTAPADPAVVAATVLDGSAGGTVVTLGYGDVIDGLTITNGSGTLAGDTFRYGGGVYYTAYATVRHCIIRNNTANCGGGIYCCAGGAVLEDSDIHHNSCDQYGAGVAFRSVMSLALNRNHVHHNTAAGATAAGGGIYFYQSGGWVTGTLVDHNSAGLGGGMAFYSGSGPQVNNATISSNTSTTAHGGGIYTSESAPGLIDGIITFCHGYGVYTSGASPVFLFCDFYGSAPGSLYGTEVGADCLAVNPLFVGGEDGEFRLQSQGGHWTPSGWVKDPVTSPCVDAGYLDMSYYLEPAPNGNRANLGL